MTKAERAIKAQQHYEDIKIKFKSQINDSIQKTRIYGPDISTRGKSNDIERSLRLIDLDSTSCLFNTIQSGKTCIVNYASYKNPGGQFLKGSSAQEEALCHESNLYPILLSFNNSYYSWNREHLNKALYLNRALYTPQVIFEHDNRIKTADVLTCAAPNYRAAHRYQNIPLSLNDEVFRDRIKFMYQIIEENQVENLIIGAWGCGVFMQNPETVCRLLTEELLLEKYAILNVYYAIPDSNSSNYKAFEKTLHTIFEN